MPKPLTLGDLMKSSLATPMLSGAFQASAKRPAKPQGQLSAYKPSFSERVEQKIGGMFGGGRYARHFAQRAMAPLNDWTPVGNIQGIQDGARMMTRGDLASVAGGAGILAMNVLPNLPGKGKAARTLGDLIKDNTGAIRAWHGSPHDFDRFDASMLGTGEGNHAYGRGLYFADRKGVAGSYVQPRGVEPLEVPSDIRKNLANLLRQDDYLGFDNVGQAIHAVRTNLTDFEKAWEVSDASAIRSALDAYDAARWPTGKRPRLYEVEINANPSDLVDYDALGPANAQRALSDPAVKGIKYLDGNSRHLGGQSYNYVIPDPALVRILNKY